MARKKTAKKPGAKQLVKSYFPPADIPRVEKAAKKNGLSVSSFIATTILRSIAEAK